MEKVVVNKLLSTRKGFSIIEIVISTALFVLIALGLFSSFIIFQRSYLIFGDENRAVLVAEEGLEAVRNIYENDFSNLSDGTFGLSFSSGEWNFFSSSDIQGIYTRKIIISSVDSETKKVISEVTWQRNNLQDGKVFLVTYFTNWQKEILIENCLLMNISSACFDNTNTRILLNASLSNVCDEDLIITSTTIFWDRADSDFTNLTIDGNQRWSFNCSWNCSPTGNQISGTVLNFGDNILTISANSTVNIDEFRWQRNTMQDYEIGPFVFSSGDGTEYNFPALTNNFICGEGEPDITAPGTITSLVASDPTIDSVLLSWISPGDDGLEEGTATEYDIRYSTSPISEINWDSAIQVLDEPLPLPAQNNQSITVSGLNHSTTYYFAMKTRDEVYNFSELSNNASIQTATVNNPQAVDLLVNTSNISLSSNNRDVQNILISNTGSQNITISNIILSWTGGQSNNAVRIVRIDNSKLWSGKASSGQVLDITDSILTPLQNRTINYFRFSRAMNGAVLNITFNMIDGSQKIISNINL